MKEFIRGWKRKIGVMTLVMACLSMSGLIRSYSVRDTVNCWAVRRIPVLLISTSGFILWGKLFLDPGTGSTFAYWTTDVIADPNTVIEISNDDASHLRWFSVVTFTSSTHSYPVWATSYWCFILPLTLISLWLLLSKPRNSGQIKIIEPITNERA